MREILIHQRYKVIEKLGEGGFSEVYLALDQRTNKECVVKHLLSRKVDNIKSIQLFEREAKILSNLDHPNIPKFIDYFTIETNQNLGGFYLVQEKLEGKTLQQLVEEGKCFYEKDVILTALEIVKILKYLHSLSPPIIHRDIKPSNIIFTINKEVYLIDFGAVKDSVSAYGIGSTLVVGTGGYMSIEQIQGRAEPASDIYSLGLSLIFLLSHKHPTEIEQEDSQLKFLPYVNISKNFQKVLSKMIHPILKKRYRTSYQLKIDLEKLLLPRVSVRDVISLPILKCYQSVNKIRNVVKSSLARVIRGVKANRLTRHDSFWGTSVGEFIYIPKGKFTRGSNFVNGDRTDKPAHRVIISRSFEIGCYQITQQQWETLMVSNPSYFKGETLPVERVSWIDVQKFIARLNAKSNMYVYALPTEAQWEYACRAGTTGKYAGNLNDMAWYSDNSGRKTHPVGQKQSNAWGLYDMHGNVEEWCSDFYEDYCNLFEYGSYSEITVKDPSGASLGLSRVVRGGSCISDANDCRSASRDSWRSESNCFVIGFRLVRVIR